MGNDLQQAMRAAMQLMREGDLAAATATIRRNLAARPEPAREGAPTIMKGLCIDGVGRVIPESANEDIPTQEFGPADPIDAQVSTTGTFSCRHGHAITRCCAARAHGRRRCCDAARCTQSPGDFARNLHARRAAAEGYVVIYPAREAPQCQWCWNWFRSTDRSATKGSRRF
jgi:hypothetical protein